VSSGLHSIWKCKPDDTSSGLSLEKLYKPDGVSSGLHFQIECKPDDTPSGLYNFSKR